MIFESEKRIYDRSNSKHSYSEWILDTDKRMIVHTDENLKVTEHWFYKDFIGYHLDYRTEKCPGVLRDLVNDGKILEYLEELEIKVTDAINEQAEIWINESKEYQIALNKGNLYDVNRIGNIFIADAKDIVYKAMVYV